ncbi:metallophosphoesterase [Devosia salina]|uniref:Metallophosphoesterase n=1 Tax=Devosia salina TaxID=2860336 RepID=A0ABX8WBV6_9HYPH|nr:metallophosphoesterase [Devosia salina]QYO75615.1 metallophosphoesterase [Devosia salina]
MTRIWVLSDLHIDVVDDLDLGRHPDADLILMAGDLCDGDFDPVPWLLSTFSDDERSKLVYVPGNHDSYNVGLDGVPDRLRHLRETTGIATLDRETIEIDGRRIVGCTMWSPLSPALDNAGGDLAAIPDFDGDAWRAAHGRDRTWLEETVAEGDIVVTHHAPSWAGLDIRMQQNPRLMSLASGYFADMTDLIEQRQPALWIHGHTHVTREYEVGDTRVVSNAAGRGRALDFQPGLVVEIDDPSPKCRSVQHG